jgi:hypothetical protein
MSINIYISNLSMLYCPANYINFMRIKCKSALQFYIIITVYSIVLKMLDIKFLDFCATRLFNHGI